MSRLKELLCFTSKTYCITCMHWAVQEPAHFRLRLAECRVNPPTVSSAAVTVYDRVSSYAYFPGVWPSTNYCDWCLKGERADGEDIAFRKEKFAVHNKEWEK